MSDLNNIFGRIKKEKEINLASQKTDLGKLDDFIKKEQEKAKNLAKTVNGYAANARDVSSGIERAEQQYKLAKDAYETFINNEKRYNDTLEDVDRFYNIVKRQGFKALNDFNDINDDLRKYNANVKISSSNAKELLKADSDWKKIPNKFPKIK